MSEQALAYVEMLHAQLTPCEYRLLLALASLAEPPTHAVQVTKRRLHEMTGVSLEYVRTCLRNLASRTPPVLGIVPQQAPDRHSPAANLYYFPGIITPASITAQQQRQRATQARQLSTLERRRAERQLREMRQMARQLEDQLAASEQPRTGT